MVQRKEIKNLTLFATALKRYQPRDLAARSSLGTFAKRHLAWKKYNGKWKVCTAPTVL
jgi:hypothetical protein